MAHEAHVWTVRLDLLRANLAEMQGLLDCEELMRAARLKSAEAAENFILCHGSLRVILSGYLALSPQCLRFSTGTNGKPELVGTADCPTFNLSHSDDLVLVAVARQPVGIDIERIKANLSFKAIAERFFSQREKADLHSLPPHRQLQAFYACWTRKEAYMKACGAGFSLPSDRFSVSVPENASPVLLDHELAPVEMRRWRIIDLNMPDGFCGALVVEQNIVEIQPFDFLGAA